MRNSTILTIVLILMIFNCLPTFNVLALKQKENSLETRGNNQKKSNTPKENKFINRPETVLKQSREANNTSNNNPTGRNDRPIHPNPENDP